MQIEITEREQAQRELQLRGRPLADALGLAHLGSWQWNLAANIFTWSDELFRIWGLEPKSVEVSYESFLERIHPGDRALVEEMLGRALASPGPFAADFRIERPDGAVRWLRAEGKVVMGDYGPLCLNGTAQDITEQKRADAELRLLGTLALATGAAEDADSALATAIAGVCEATQWVLGAAWAPNSDGTHLEYVCGWDEGAPGLEEFRVVSEGLTVAAGTGLPGRVWSSREPAWIRDVTLDSNFPRAPWAVEAGLKAAFAVPVTSDEEVLAVLEFFVREPRAEDERLMGIVSAVAAQLGAVIRRKRTEDALRESEQRQRTMIETSNDAVVSIDASGAVTDWNRAASAIFGWSREEAIGATLAELIIPERYREAHRQGLARYVDTGVGPVVGETIEVAALHREGSEIPVELTIWQVRGGERPTFSAFVRDITERRQAREELEEREQQLAHAQALAHIGSWQWDVASNVVTWSDELFRIYGLEPQSVEISYESFLERTHSDDRALVEETVGRAYASGTPFEFDHRIEHPDGALRWLHARGEVLMGHSGPVRMNGIAQDITVQKRADDALQLLAHRLERSNRDLEDFASSASHDLREPLRKVQAFGDRLSAKYGHALPEEGRQYIDRMLGAADRMQSLIDGLIQLARLGANEEPFSTTDLGAIARDVISDLEARIDQSGSTVELGALPTVEANPVEMRQLLVNLVGNAIKFHRPGEPAKVAISAESVPDDRGGGGVCRLLVRDNGVGFDEKYLDRIFEPFQRLHGRSEHEGAGIGLALCRKIAERHGGSITAQSIQGQGSVFVVTLPLRHPVRAVR